MIIKEQQKSKILFEEAKKIIPGGVSSPIRAIKPYPFYIKKAHGSFIIDIDDNKYLDYCLAYGPLILGHSNDEIKYKIIEQLNNGWLYGTPCELEVEMAKFIIKYYKSMDMIRFVSTGTEATMSAIRLARGFTGKENIIKIKGGYHGSHDSVLVKSRDMSFCLDNIKHSGIPYNISENTFQIEYNSIEDLVTLVENHNLKDKFSCLIMEPVLGNTGCILPEKNYLQEVRKITMENDILLIFDEVITGFRLSMGGAQSYYGVSPDITTLGKVIGGGLPMGAFGAKKELMEHIAPSGNIYQAGTFSGNPLSLCSGLSTLKYIEKNDICNKLNNKCFTFYSEFNDMLLDSNLKNDYYLSYISSMFTLFFNKKITNHKKSLKCNNINYNIFLRYMMKNGIFFSPSQYETNFISYSHTEEDLVNTINIIKNSILYSEKNS